MLLLSLGFHQTLVGAVILVSFLGLALMSRLCAVLRARHIATWVSLGEPAILSHFSPRIQWRVNRFVWRGDYRQLADSELRRVALGIRAMTIVTLALLTLLAVWPAAGV